MDKDNTWNIRGLVDETIVQSTQQPNAFYIEDCRISTYKWETKVGCFRGFFF
jgi:hypothetical protein